MSWVEEYRAQFPAAAECVYLDNAYDCGGTLIGKAAAERYFDDWNYAAVHNERGGPGRATLFKTIDETREYLARLVGGAGPDRVAFTRNTNEGINGVLQGFDFRPGDNIVTDGQEHESVLMPCLNVQRTRGIEVKIAPVRADGGVSVEELKNLADAHTRMILVSHVQSATGYKIDLKKLGTWCSAHGIFLIVDGIQSLGLCPFHADDWCVDAVSASSYKGLCGTNSSAFTYYQPELLKHIWPVYTAAGPYMHVDRSEDGYSLYCNGEEKARKMENSSLDNIGIYIMHDSVKTLLEIGIDQIWEHVSGLYEKFYDGLAALGYSPVTPKEAEKRCGILSLKLEDKEEFFAFMRSRNICLSISAGIYIRFSLGAFNNEADIEAALEAVRAYKNR